MHKRILDHPSDEGRPGITRAFLSCPSAVFEPELVADPPDYPVTTVHADSPAFPSRIRCTMTNAKADHLTVKVSRELVPHGFTWQRLPRDAVQADALGLLALVAGGRTWSRPRAATAPAGGGALPGR
jgi:hypothetical protein